MSVWLDLSADIEANTGLVGPIVLNAAKKLVDFVILIATDENVIGFFMLPTSALWEKHKMNSLKPLGLVFAALYGTPWLYSEAPQVLALRPSLGPRDIFAQLWQQLAAAQE